MPTWIWHCRSVHNQGLTGSLQGSTDRGETDQAQRLANRSTSLRVNMLSISLDPPVDWPLSTTIHQPTGPARPLSSLAPPASRVSCWIRWEPCVACSSSSVQHSSLSSQSLHAARAHERTSDCSGLPNKLVGSQLKFGLRPSCTTAFFFPWGHASSHFAVL